MNLLDFYKSRKKKRIETKIDKSLMATRTYMEKAAIYLSVYIRCRPRDVNTQEHKELLELLTKHIDKLDDSLNFYPHYPAETRIQVRATEILSTLDK